jgi:hypothetical protein
VKPAKRSEQEHAMYHGRASSAGVNLRAPSPDVPPTGNPNEAEDADRYQEPQKKNALTLERAKELGRAARKDVRAMKAEGIHPWEAMGATIRPARAEAAEEAEETPSTRNQARVAASFAAKLKDLGFDVYLSGGAALHWHGGAREIADLDFRVRHGARDVGNFEDAQGAALTAALNDWARSLRSAGFDVGEFRALGGGGLTIVCDDFCGSEVSQIGNVHHPEYPEVEDFGDAMVRGNGGSGYVRVDWFTPDGLSTWGDGRLTILGSNGFIELRKYVDIAGRAGGDHLFIVDQKETKYIDCRDVPLPYGTLLVDDVLNRTETAMPQAHVFLAMELALLAEKNARRVTSSS